MVEVYVPDGRFPNYNSSFVFTFCRLLNLGQKLKMIHSLVTDSQQNYPDEAKSNIPELKSTNFH